MRKVGIILVSLFAILGLLAPPSFAQAPAPKVTINGLVDFVTSWYSNTSGDGAIADGGRDITSRRDKGWYSRERGVFTLTGEVGKSKGVLALEFDFHNGRTQTNLQDGGFGGNSGIDMETDEKGQVEVKWLYLETPITGPGSLMPFIPVESIGRFGAQPARFHDYKPAIQFTGDFPGVSLETTWAPNLRSALTYAQIEERLDAANNPVNATTGFTNSNNDNWAALLSVEVDIFKGLTVKPTLSYLVCAQGCTGNNGNRLTSPTTEASGVGTFARGGFDPATNAGPGTGASLSSAARTGFTTVAGQQFNLVTRRYTAGGDVRWTAGPWSLQPTFLYQWGKQELAPNVALGKEDVKIRTWIADVIAGFRSGPLTIEVRGQWTPGMKANECVQRIVNTTTGFVCNGGHKIEYYEPILQSSTGYFSGWTEIEASGIDYNNTLRSPGSGAQLGRSPSYDKYGRRAAGVAADYALTPALTFHAVALAQWTDEKVDRTALVLSGTSVGGGGISLVPRANGTDRYLGTEVDTGFTYRFAPNMAFDLIGGVLFVGDARDMGSHFSAVNGNVVDAAAGQHFNAQDAYKVAARLRVTW